MELIKREDESITHAYRLVLRFSSHWSGSQHSVNSLKPSLGNVVWDLILDLVVVLNYVNFLI